MDGREMPEDGRLVIPQADILPANLTVSVANATSAESSFVAAEELNAALADAIDGDLTLDVSGVDVTEDGYQVVPAQFALAPSFDDNYEIVGNIFGDIYVKKARYYVTFTVNNEGEQWTRTYPLDYNTDKAVKDYSFYSEMTSAVNTLLKKSANTTLVGWSVYTDSFNVPSDDANYRGVFAQSVFLNPDASTYVYGSKTYTFNLAGICDYHFVAQVSKAAADQLYVTTIPSVYYDGRAHVALGTKVNAKKQAADLRVVVYAEGNSDPLTPGKDFSVTYKNNTKASMRLVREDGNIGSYVPLYDAKTESNKRPKVIITGKGTYKGFSAEVYFDILPVSLGGTEEFVSDAAPSINYSKVLFPYTNTESDVAVLSGFAVSYPLSGVSKIKAPKVTKRFTTYGYDTQYQNINQSIEFTNTLKEGTDYVLEFYRYDSATHKWVKQTATAANKLTEAGDYLCVVRGIGNYCGAVYNSYANWVDEEFDRFDSFDPDGQSGEVNPARDLSSPHQFRIAADAKYDFSKVKVSIGKKALPFAVTESGNPKSYSADDFKITLKNSAGETLMEGRDYLIDFYATKRKRWDSLPDSADEYTVHIYPDGNYYGPKRVAGKVRITGLKLKSSYFKLNSKTVGFGEYATISLTEAGVKAGLSLSSSSPYFVYFWRSYPGYPASSSKIMYEINGIGCGAGIDTSSSVRFNVTRKTLSLQEATKYPAAEKPYVGFSVTTPEVTYNVKGALPTVQVNYLNSSGNVVTQTIALPYSGYTECFYLHDTSGNSMGGQFFTFQVKNNTKVGQTATVTVTSKGVFKGTTTVGTFQVAPCNINSIQAITPYTTYYSTGSIYAVFTDAQAGKGSLDKPNVKLYQAYNNKGKIQLAALSKKQFTVDHVMPTADGLGCTVFFSSPSGDYQFNAGASYFGLYGQAKLPSVARITIDGTEYTITKNNIEGYTPTFTGAGIYPNVTAITLNDAANTRLNSDDWYITYTPCHAAGKQAGSLTLTMKYNAVSGRYPYKGKITLKFDILESGRITL